MSPQPSATTLTEYAAALEWVRHQERQRILEAVLELEEHCCDTVSRADVIRVIS